MRTAIKNKKIIICLLALGTLMIASTALASLVSWPNSPLGTPLDPDGSKTGEKSTLTELIKYVYEWAIALGGLAAFIALVIAGSQYMSSAGNPALMQESKDRIKFAFLGLALLLGSWLILNVINPELTTLRPVSEGFKEDLDATIGCKDNDDCKEKFGSNFMCDKDNVCRQDWESLLSHKPCSKIFILAEGAPDGGPGSPGNEIEIGMGDYYFYRPEGEGTDLEILLLPGEKFWWWTEPTENCWGLLNIYEGDEIGTRCTKDYQPFLADGCSQEPGEMGYGQSQATIFCMEFIEVPSWQVPEFAHNPRAPSLEDDPDVPPDLPDDPSPKEPAPEICDTNMEFCDADGECRNAHVVPFKSGWCYHNWRWAGDDPNRYYFCVDDTWYSFECKGDKWNLNLRCDPDKAWKKVCPGGCDPWSCTKGQGCVEGSGICNP